MMTKEKYKEGDIVLHIPSGRKYKIASIDGRWCVLAKEPMADGNYWTIPYRGRLDNDKNFKLWEGGADDKQ